MSNLTRADKITLLKNYQAGRLEKQVFIVYTDDDRIIDPDNRKHLQPGDEANYLKQVQRENPLHIVVPHIVTKEKYKAIV